MFKKSVVLKSRAFKPKSFDYEALILFSLFLCGVILGAFLIKNVNDEIENALTALVKSYITTKSENGFLTCFSGCFVFLLIFLIIAFLFGMCAIGTPFVWSVPVIFGIFCGGYISLLVINYGFKGILYCILVDLIPYAITAASLVRCCCESTSLSINLFTCIAGESALRGRNIFKEYALKYLVLCIPVILGALISAFLFKIFQGLFIFV